MSKMLQSFSPESDGYQFMWIILVVFVIGLGFSIERFFYIMVKSSSGRAKFMADFGKLVMQNQLEQALQFAKSSNLPIAKVMDAIVGAKLNCKDADKARDMMTAASDAVFLTEAPRLTRYISIISVMASISTLLGLMGTIYGLIERAKALADGIAIAMGTTLLGLLSAVPLLVIVGLLNMNSERLIQEMEEKGLKIINSLA